MMYPFMTLDNDAENVHSKMGKAGYLQKVENGIWRLLFSLKMRIFRQNRHFLCEVGLFLGKKVSKRPV